VISFPGLAPWLIARRAYARGAARTSAKPPYLSLWVPYPLSKGHERAAVGAQLRRLPRIHVSVVGCRADPDDVPGQMGALQSVDEPAAGVDLPAAQSVTSRGGKGVVVVVPGLAEGQRCEPGEVAGLIARGERSPAEVVAQRVDAEGRVMQEEHAHRSAPQQTGQPAHDRAGQCHAEAEGNRQAGHHPQREGAADEAQVAVGAAAHRSAAQAVADRPAGSDEFVCAPVS